MNRSKLFYNGSVLDAVGEIKAQKFSLSLPFKISKIVDFGTFAPIAVQALVIGSPLSEV